MTLNRTRTIIVIPAPPHDGLVMAMTGDMTGGVTSYKYDWGGDRGGVEKIFTKNIFKFCRSQKITKNHEKSQKITKVYRFGLLQLCCNCGVILPSNAQLCSVVRKCV